MTMKTIYSPTLRLISCLLCFLLLVPFNLRAQEKISSIESSAKSRSVLTKFEKEGLIYYVTTESWYEASFWTFDPATGETERLFSAFNEESFQFNRTLHYQDRFFLFGNGNMYEVLFDEKKLELHLDMGDFETLGNVRMNGSRLYVNSLLGWGGVDILIYDFATEEVIVLREGVADIYLFEDERGELISDKVLSTQNEDGFGLFSYAMLSDSLDLLNGSEQLLGVNLRDFIHDRDGQFYCKDRENGIWKADVENDTAFFLLQIDPQHSIRHMHNSGAHLDIFTQSDDTESNAIIFRYNFESAQVDTVSFPEKWISEIYQLKGDAGYVTENGRFTYLNLSTGELNALLGPTGGTLRILKSDPAGDQATISVSTDPIVILSVGKTSAETQILFDVDAPGPVSKWLKTNTHDYVFVGNNTDGNWIGELSTDSISQRITLFERRIGADFELFEGEDGLIASTLSNGQYRVRDTLAQIHFQEGASQTARKYDISALGSKMYMWDQLERQVIWELSENSLTATRFTPDFPMDTNYSISAMFSANDQLYVQARIGNNRYLCEINLETNRFECLMDTSNLGNLLVRNTSQFMLGDSLAIDITTDSFGREPWIITDNISDSYMLDDYREGTSDSNNSDPVHGEGVSLFVSGLGFGLMRSDGTQEGTWTIHPSSFSLDAELFTDGLFYFSRGDAIYATDAETPALDYQFSAEHPDNFFAWNGDIFFMHDGVELHKFRPGDDDHTFVTSFHPTYTFEILPATSHIFAHKLISTGSYMQELRVTDGTPENTSILMPEVGLRLTEPEFAVAGDVLLFAQYDPGNGMELWISDGSENGTHLFADVNPGTSGSFPKLLGVHGEYFYFTAIYQEEGRQLFRLALDALNTVATREVVHAKYVRAFPNPVSEVLFLSLEDQNFFPEKISLINAAGIPLWSQKYSSDVWQINVQDLSPGMFFLRVDGSDVSETLRFVKVNK